MFKMEKKMQNSASIHKKDHATTRSILTTTGVSATTHSTALSPQPGVSAAGSAGVS